MPKRKNQGPCSVIGCGKPIDIKTMCRRHYFRTWKNGTPELIRKGDRVDHPLYRIWYERKDRESLCSEWMDFYAFAEGVGERPTPEHYLGRVREYDPYGPDNFEWRLIVRRDPEHSDAEHHARKWKLQKEKNPALDVGRHLLRDFGITPARFAEMLAEQDGRCFICRQVEWVKHKKTGVTKSLSVDHCHATDVVRDLLCARCNHVVGFIKENRALAHAVADYLDRWADPVAKARELGRPERLAPESRSHIIGTEWGPMSVSDAARKAGLTVEAVMGRIARKWPEDKLLIPLRRPRRLRPLER